MAEQFYTILTAVGKAKIANAAALGKKVELAELALGDGSGSYYNPTEDQTALKNEVWRGVIGSVDVDEENPNWIIIQAVVPSQHGGFMIREAGVFDNEGDLIAIGKYPETYKPVAADGSVKDLVIRMILEVSNTASVVLKVDPTVILATQQQVNEAEAKAKAYTDQEVGEVVQDLAAHKADKVHQGEVHGMKFNERGKLEVWNGVEWIELKGGGLPVNITTNIQAVGGDKQVELTWQDPEDVLIEGETVVKWKSTAVVRKQGSMPKNDEDGVLITRSSVRNQYRNTPFVDTNGLENDKEYFYGIFPQSEDEIVTVSEKEIISVIPTAQKIYGVEIDESNSNPETSVVYTDDAVGFIPARGNNGNFSWGSWENIIKDEFKIRPCVLRNLGGGNAEVNYYLDYDDYTKKADGSNSRPDGVDGDVMIEFGVPLWWKFSRVGSKLKIQLSNREFDGAIKPAFEIEDGYNLVPFYPLTLTQILYVLMFKNLDSQTALGRGRVDGAEGYAATGGTNTKGMFYGSEADEQMKFLGIEDYWGNRRWWIDGCFYDDNRNMLIGKGNFNNTGNGYTNYGQATPSDGGGYIDRVQGQNETGFIPASISGSATTYYCDYGHVYAGRLPAFGGHRSSSANAGGFYLRSDTAPSSHADIGGRLFYSQNGKIYIGAYLGVEQNGRLRSISGYESANNKTIGEFRNLARANN